MGILEALRREPGEWCRFSPAPATIFVLNLDHEHPATMIRRTRPRDRAHEWTRVLVQSGLVDVNRRHGIWLRSEGHYGGKQQAIPQEELANIGKELVCLPRLPIVYQHTLGAYNAEDYNGYEQPSTE